MKILRKLSFVLAAVLLFSLFGCAKTDEKSCIKTDKITVTKEMYAYYFNSYYRSFFEKYADYVTSNGFDYNKPLTEQKYNDEMTWFDYLRTNMERELDETVTLCSGAEAQNYELTDEEKIGIQEALDEIESEAKKKGVSVDKYVSELYGEETDIKTVESCIEMKITAESFKKYLMGIADASDETCLKIFEEDTESLVHCDYAYLTVPEEDVETLKKSYDKSSFLHAMREVIAKNSFGGNYGAYQGYIDAEVNNQTVYRAEKDASPFSEWAFSNEREPFEIYTEKQLSGEVAVYMIFSAENYSGKISSVLYKDTEPLRVVSYAKFDSVETATEIYNANENITADVLKEYKDYAETEFSVSVNKGTCPPEIREWVFGDETEVGESGLVVATEKEAYIVIYERTGEASWKEEARAVAIQNGYNGLFGELEEKYPIKKDEFNIKKIKTVSISQ